MVRISARLSDRLPAFAAVLLISSILALSAVVAASLAVAGGRDASASTISAKGKKVRLTPRARRGARFIFHGTLPEAYLLGIRGDRAFYRLVGRGHENCFGTGPAETIGKPGGLGCWRRLSPLLDESVVEITRGSSQPRLLRIEGFAADGITRVAALDHLGRTVAQAAVTDNIYYLGAPAGGWVVTRVVALDSSGNVVGGVDFPRASSGR
jgi:hypothetical protein